MNKMDEQIVVVPRVSLELVVDKLQQGVVTDTDYIKEVIIAIQEDHEIMRRGDAEDNPVYKQPIPYVVMTQNKEVDGEIKPHVFIYERLKGGGEARLHNKLSIGVGGHMNTFGTFISVLDEARREIEEELIISEPPSLIGKDPFSSVHFAGILNDDSDEVGQVHIGIIVHAELGWASDVQVRETDQLDGRWISFEELSSNEDMLSRLENWSRLAFQALYHETP